MPYNSGQPLHKIPLTTYLFTRLRQLGVQSVHGVPGDYNLSALDHVSATGLTWIGNCNELNAGYAADGYSRIKGVGALITAFGVGELSAINAIGGAYAEHAAVVHVVGTPPRNAQMAGACLHHSLGDGDFRVFARMAAMVTVAQADLKDERTAGEEIDRVLRECVVQSRPVYIELPTDMVNVAADAERLSTLIDSSPAADGDKEREKAEDEVLDCILDRIAKTSQPFLIIDGFTARWSIFPEVEQLVRLLGWPTTSTPFGKSCIDETLPNFHGIYAGPCGASVYTPWVNDCDLVLRFGGLDSDANTYAFSSLPPTKSIINFHRDNVVFGDSGRKIEGLRIKPLLRKLILRLTDLEAKDRTAIPRMDPYPDHLGNPRAELAALPPADPRAPIEQHDFWRRISHFFQEGDVILTETGTPGIGSRDFVLPRNARLVNSSIWLSIGYMLAAAQGAAMAVREINQQPEQRWQEREADQGRYSQAERALQNRHANPDPDSDCTELNMHWQERSVLSPSTSSGRTILFEGDGSFQMTAQELSTIIKHRLDLTLFLINNDGYTVERLIHGMRAHYNDVWPWRYLDAPSFFGGGRDADQRAAVKDEGDSVANGAEHVNGICDPHDENLCSNTSPTTRCEKENFRQHKRSNQGQTPHRQNQDKTTPYKIQTHHARTWSDLHAILAKAEVRSGKGLCMIEVCMDREDAPESFKKMVRHLVSRNTDEVVEEKVLTAAAG